MAFATADFAILIEILPASDTTNLKCHDKLVRNTADVKTNVWGWTHVRRVEAGSCSFCFDTLSTLSLLSHRVSTTCV
ncbi:hypothetical protein F4859DRAFT_473859 [Xylaria cf. heliscus]|nr:hypothetical protein F4859DRAFT_473859 [Xylaria cf. heliscus]